MSRRVCPKCGNGKYPLAKQCFSCKCKTSVHQQRVRVKDIIRNEIRRRDGDCCGYCGISLRNIQSHLEHVIPTSRGGRDDLENLIITCRFCNMAKGACELAEFFGWLAHIRSGNFVCKARPIIDGFLRTAPPEITDRMQKSWWVNG